MQSCSKTQECKCQMLSSVSSQTFESTWKKLLTEIYIGFPKLSSWPGLNLNSIKSNSERDWSSGRVLWFWLAKWTLGCLHCKITPSLLYQAYITVLCWVWILSVQKAAHTPESNTGNCLDYSVSKDCLLSEQECSEHTAQQQSTNEVQLTSCMEI